MAFNFFGAGRKRRTVRRKVRRGGRKVGGSPSKALIKIAKHYGVRVTIGKSHKYKSSTLIKRQCAKKIRSLIKKHKKTHSTRRKVSSTRRKVSSTRRKVSSTRRKVARFGATRSGKMASQPRGKMMLYPPMAPQPRDSRYRRSLNYIKTRGLSAARGVYRNKGRIAALAALSAGVYAGNKYHKMTPDMKNLLKYKYSRGRLGKAPQFGKRRRTRRKSATAMFGKKRQVGRPRKTSRSKRRVTHRKTSRYRFGNGGNPSLSQTMGNEFCAGGGGVLGAMSTGLFPSPCMGSGMSVPAAAFGKRRRTRRRM